MGRPFSCFVYKRICSLLIILGLGRLNPSKVMESFPPTLPGFNSLYNTLVIFVVVFFLVFQSLDHPLSEIHRLEHLCTKNTAIQIRYWKPQPIQHFIFGKTRNSFLFFILYFLEKQRVKRVRSPIRSRELEIESHSSSMSPSFIHLPVANTKIPSVVFRSNEQQFLTVSKSGNWSVPQPPRSRCDFVTRGVSGMVPGLRLLGAVWLSRKFGLSSRGIKCRQEFRLETAYTLRNDSAVREATGLSTQASAPQSMFCFQTPSASWVGAAPD